MKRIVACVVLGVLLGACGGGGGKKSTSVAAGVTTVAPYSVPTIATHGTSTSGLCGEKDKFSGLNQGPTNGDYASYFTKVQQALQRAKSEAAPEIKADMNILANAFTTVYDAFKAANFDATKIDPSKLTAVNTPAVQGASKHITDWVASHCK